MDATGMKNFFFDRAAVTDRLPPAERQALAKVGAFVRRRAKSSLKYGKRSSPPGRPPTVHKTSGFNRKKAAKGVTTRQPASPLRELLYFAYDRDRRSVVIGPALFRGKAGGGVVPAVLEYGGGDVSPHPYMRPALAAESPNAAPTFKDLIR
jgi:hypothetical protein